MTAGSSGIRIVAALSVFVALIAAGRSDAQSAGDLVLPELPFTSNQGFYARAAGMGFAHAAVVEDGSSLLYNPAGLAQVRRLELGAGLVYGRQDREVGFETPLGWWNTETGVSNTHLSHFSLAYPIPTYRGSLVVGFAYQFQNSLRSDYYREGPLVEETGSSPGLVERESYVEDGAVNYWTFGLAGDFSSSISIGGSLTYIEGWTRQNFDVGRFRQRGDVLDVEGSDEVFRSIEERDADIDGFTGSFGILGRLSDKARIAFNIDLPRDFDFEGTFVSSFEDQEKIDDVFAAFTDDITLPISVTAGIALTPPNLLLAADVRFTDWSEIQFEGPIQAQDREYAYRSTADIRVGAEYQIPSTTTRLRAGYNSEPLPYRLIPGEITFTFVPDDNDPDTFDDASYFTRDYPEARITTDRRYVTLGLGTLIEEALMVDVAWVHGMFEREAAGFTEKWTNDRILLSTTFRF